MPDRSRGRRRYPRTLRVNEVLREVLADALERQFDDQESLRLVTITGVEADPDLRHARVYVSALEREGVVEALEGVRVHLQSAIADETRMKRTPQLSFMLDPAITSGERVEDILRRLKGGGES